MTDLEKFREIVGDMGIRGEDMAEKLGIAYSSYRAATRPSHKNPPMWLTAFIVGYNFKNDNNLKQ